MPLNAADAYNQALELFSSLYQDMSPTDLPSGLSPDNSDVWFLPGLVQTRPALNKTLATPPESGLDTVSLCEFALPNGDFLTLWMYSDGTLWQQDDDTLTVTQIPAVLSPGSQFCSVTAFNKQFFAFYNQALSDAFSESPFSGADVPRYLDANGDLWRVTQDAPAINPIFSSVPTAPIPLLQSGPTGSVTITAVVSTGIKTITVNIPNQPPYTYRIYTTLTYTCTTAPPSTWVGQQITVTGLTGTNASLANVTGIIRSVSGDTFVLEVGTGQTFVNLSGQTATGTVSGNYFTRTGNIVTAYTNGAPPNFFAGLYAQILNADGSQIDGPNWTISTIARDATGLVTVTISTQLTNLPSGALLYINATDTTDFPVGFQNVYEVLSASGGTTVFTISNPTWGNGAVVSSSAGGSVYQQWSGVFQILSVGVDANSNNYFTYFQLGPDASLDSTGGTPQAQVQAQIPPGPRSAVCMFKSVNGAITAPSVPVQLSIVGGTNLLSANLIPIGPPGTAQRILAFTPAYGAQYFYITPSYIPSDAGISPVLSLGTIINDNTTISAVLDFSDAQLTAGTEIDIQGNDLFNQVVLAPSLGCIEYEGRLGWWGEINDVKNLINGHFDGGYIPDSGTVTTNGTNVTLVSGDEWINVAGIPAAAGSTIVINGVPYVIATVPSGTTLTLTSSAGTQTAVPFVLLSPNGRPMVGWTPQITSPALVYLIAQSDVSLGFAAQFISSAGAPASILQNCYQDYYGAPIIAPNTPQIFRCLATLVPGAGGTIHNLTVSIISPSLGTLALNVLSVLPTTQGWITLSLPAIPNIPADAQLSIGFSSNALTATPATLTLDEIEMIDATQPVLFQQMRLSYFDNEFGYDEETGILGFDGAAKITAAFKQRSYLYALTDGPLYQTQNNGQTEPDGWSFTAFADECDCFGPNAVTTTEDLAWWAGRAGWRVFSGAQPKKLSQEIQPTWETINQNYPTCVWAVNDPIERLTYLGVPVNGATKPNRVLPMSYRSVDAAYNVPDPIHTSYSGKVIATDLCRKWTRWNMTMSCGAMLTRPGLQKQMFFGGQAHANFYSLNFALYTDDDYGQIFSYYTTYFFFNHDIEQNAPNLGLHQKVYTYLTAYITGVGLIQPTALANNLDNPWETVAAAWDPINQMWVDEGSPANPFAAVPLINGVLENDLEWGLNLKNVARCAIKWAVSPNPQGSSPSPATDAAFQLTHMVMSCRDDRVSPVRGSNQ